MMRNKNHHRDLLFRLAGLFCVCLIAIILMGCGLALAFGNYQLSMIFFFAVLGIVVFIKVAFIRWK